MVAVVDPAPDGVVVVLLVWALTKLYQIEKRLARLEARLGVNNHG